MVIDAFDLFIFATKRTLDDFFTFVLVVILFILVSKLLRAFVAVEHFRVDELHEKFTHPFGHGDVVLFASRTRLVSDALLAVYIFAARALG